MEEGQSLCPSTVKPRWDGPLCRKVPRTPIGQCPSPFVIFHTLYLGWVGALILNLTHAYSCRYDLQARVDTTCNRFGRNADSKPYSFMPVGIVPTTVTESCRRHARRRCLMQFGIACQEVEMDEHRLIQG